MLVDVAEHMQHQKKEISKINNLALKSPRWKTLIIDELKLVNLSAWAEFISCNKKHCNCHKMNPEKYCKQLPEFLEEEDNFH